jgi:hypothetical protein
MKPCSDDWWVVCVCVSVYNSVQGMYLTAAVTFPTGTHTRTQSMLSFADRMITKSVLKDQMSALTEVYGQIVSMYRNQKPASKGMCVYMHGNRDCLTILHSTPHPTNYTIHYTTPLPHRFQPVLDGAGRAR